MTSLGQKSHDHTNLRADVQKVRGRSQFFHAPSNLGEKIGALFFTCPVYAIQRDPL
jgi:hypothetical protein